MKNIFLQLLFWFGLFFILVSVGNVLKAEDTFKDPNPNIVLTEWTTQLIYDTTNACYQGTVKWIMLSHPSLYGIPPGLESAREMITHCFCVMDRIRNEFEVEEYRKKVFDGEFIGTLFMNKAFECVRDEKTLSKFFTAEGSSGILTVPLVPDNTTNGEVEDSPESPDRKREESDMAPQTIFQG